MKTRTTLLTLALFTFAGCLGPKGSPEGSVKSFFKAAVKKDFEAMAETLDEEQRRKLGSNPAAKLAYMFDEWNSCYIDIEDYTEDADGKNATVRFSCLATTIVNYKEKQFDCSDNLALVKEEDGKWHVILAMGKTLRPM